jgi:hypothetical protein
MAAPQRACKTQRSGKTNGRSTDTKSRRHEPRTNVSTMGNFSAQTKTLGGPGSAKHAATPRRLRDVAGYIGYHLCGAHLRNEVPLRHASEKPSK